MLRTSRRETELRKPLLPQESDVKGDNDGHENQESPKEGGVSYIYSLIIRRGLEVMLTARLLVLYYAFDQETVYLLPGESLVFAAALFTAIQTFFSTTTFIKARLIENIYILMMMLLNFATPLWLTYRILATIVPIQAVVLGIEIRTLLLKDEILNSNSINNDSDVFGVRKQSDIYRAHWGITCNLCHAHPIVGVRYKACHVDNYNLCENCEKQATTMKGDLKETNFEAIRQPPPVTDQLLLELRYEEVRLREAKLQQKDLEGQEAVLTADFGEVV